MISVATNNDDIHICGVCNLDPNCMLDPHNNMISLSHNIHSEVASECNF